MPVTTVSFDEVLPLSHTSALQRSGLRERHVLHRTYSPGYGLRRHVLSVLPCDTIERLAWDLA